MLFVAEDLNIYRRGDENLEYRSNLAPTKNFALLT
jgi:hypothetical protein